MVTGRPVIPASAPCQSLRHVLGATTPVTGRPTFACQALRAAPVSASKTPVAVTRAVPSAADSARWRRRTSGPAEPVFSTGLAPTLSRETQCRGANFAWAGNPCAVIHAPAAVTVAWSYVPLIGPSYEPCSLSRHCSAGTTLAVAPGTSAG